MIRRHRLHQSFPPRMPPPAPANGSDTGPSAGAERGLGGTGRNGAMPPGAPVRGPDPASGSGESPA